MTTKHWPTELRLTDGGLKLVMSYEDAAFTLSAEYLRVMSPSAEVQGHSAAERRTVGGKRGIRIKGVEPVGNYAVKLVFEDGHDSGLYTWDYLYALGAEEPQRWAAYLGELGNKGLSRDVANR